MNTQYITPEEQAHEMRKKQILEERTYRNNMAIGEILPDEEWRRDSVEKNKLMFFLMSKGMVEEYIDFCSQSKCDWQAVLLEMTML